MARWKMRARQSIFPTGFSHALHFDLSERRQSSGLLHSHYMGHHTMLLSWEKEHYVTGVAAARPASTLGNKLLL